jgi:predicted nucleotidyltransferase
MQRARTDLAELVAVASAIHSERYADAQVVFLAGSLVRGEGTSTSDLDLVVVFARVDNAYRESFECESKLVESFVHDPQTLSYFFSRAKKLGIPILQTMVSEGVEIPSSSEFSRSLKQLADRAIAEGPEPWSKADIDSSRYAITNLVDDLRDPRSRAEQTATGSALYGALSTHFLRRQGLWSAKDKAIPRALRRTDSVFSQSFESAFEALFREGDSAKVIALADGILVHDGGWLFSGYKLPAPPEWREQGER